eukprot:8063690-Pyramimonas_sp.AAC.1
MGTECRELVASSGASAASSGNPGIPATSTCLQAGEGEEEEEEEEESAVCRPSWGLVEPVRASPCFLLLVLLLFIDEGRSDDDNEAEQG